jgi:putative endonuclease
MKRLAAAKKRTPYCYILRCADGSFYTGWTNDLVRRLRQHRSGNGGRYTRTHSPVELVYFEPQEDKSAARRREAAIKQLPRAKKSELVAGSAAKKPFRKKKGPVPSGP